MKLNSDGTLTIEAKLTSGEFKFRANDDWAINLGITDTEGILVQDGANIAVSEPGKYLITLILTGADYTYGMIQSSSDERAMFYTDGQTLEIENVADFSNGYAVTKWKNITSDGVAGSDPTHVDTDFPVFRIADAYLIYAEAALRGGENTNLDLALKYVNKVRTRAYTDDSGNISAEELTLNFIIDERARELYWEGSRRTDLVRFGLLTGDNYIWPWKGGVQEGTGTNERYNIYPIPASDVIANPNLSQVGDY
jgi:hypothetical protein